MLKIAAPTICDSLCDLFNYSLESPQVPSEWKNARITPVPKRSNSTSAADFRPISILPVVAKVFESLVHKQVASFLDDFSLLHEAQSGFRSNHSTQDVLLKVVEDWRNSIEADQIVASVFIDLRRAFDSVDHTLLLQKLHLYGFRGASLAWFKSYLDNRRQCVYYDGQTSDNVHMSMGVPQGSILGPLLFCVFVNDLPSVLNKCKMMLYADDTIVYFGDRSKDKVEEILTNELDMVARWVLQNGLSMNLEKTQFTGMARRRESGEANQLNIMVNGKPLVKSDVVKYLGVYVDSNLKWDKHISFVRQKCYSILSFLGKACKSLPTCLRKQLYQSLVLPHLDYCSVVWTECSRADEKKLEGIQKRGMRWILQEKWDCPSDTLRKKLGWSCLASRRNMLRLMAVKRCMSGRCPQYLKGFFVKNKDLGRRTTRQSENLHLPHHQTNWLGQSFQYQGGSDWNRLPISIRDDSVSKEAFKRQILNLF